MLLAAMRYSGHLNPFKFKLAITYCTLLKKKVQYLGISSHYHRKILVKIISYLQGVADVYL
jgi:hypothetical protein